MASRRLNLHVSALNDAEYELYTTSLADITLSDSQDDGIEHDDTYFENISVSVREARAWLRGRYSHIPATTLDNILRLFSPTLSQTEVLSGGQFFAALRLVVHVESGKDVDRALAFVQAHPNTTSSISRPSSPTKLQNQASQNYPVSSRRSSESTNPFSVPPQHHTVNSNRTHNPFSSSRSVSAKSHDGASDSAPSKLPPLPPRKSTTSVPGFQPPPRHGSFASTNDHQPPPPPPKPASLHSHPSHTTSALIKQSLIASKNGKTWKQADERLEKERVLRVLRSSESSSSTSNSSSFAQSRARSSSPHKPNSSASSSSYTSSSEQTRAPPLPRRNTNKKPPSPPMSTTSFQQVALAGKDNSRNPSFSSHNPFKTSQFQSSSVLDAPRFTHSPSTSPVHKSTELPPMPPKHPDQNSNSPSHRKPPPPIPSNLPSSVGLGHKRAPSFTQLRNSADVVQTNADERDFEAIYGAKPKTASPYVSTFSREPDSRPSWIRGETAQESWTHLNGNVSSENSPSRMFRSKSLHHPSPTSLTNRLVAADLGDPNRSPFSPLVDDTPEASPGPSPGVRKKRPESIQVAGNNTYATEWSPKRSVDLSTSPSPTSTLSRHMSLSTPSHTNTRRHQREVSSSGSTVGLGSSSDNPLKSLAASLQPQLLSMQQQLQPHLDKARYKAEAGLTKRGFVRDHKPLMKPREEEEGLMQNGRADGWEQLSVADDDSDEGDESYERVRQHDRKGRSLTNGSMSGGTLGGWNGSMAPVGIEKDNLKWPVGEDDGWKPL
ncbi:hypothetical protein C8R42DRAFT_669010 [Lentinula raphanica]|nr:hypothetical protein C8R42DRAFT_669010 [Lentinula raphanica]